MTGRLLVSFCNFATQAKPSGLLLVDTATWSSRWVDIGYGGELAVSSVGIALDDQFVYHVSIAQQDFDTVLSVLDRQTLDVLHIQVLAEVKDGHSVIRVGDEIYVASTGTDEVIAYQLDGYRPVRSHPVWAATDSGDDTHHLNSLAVAGPAPVVSAFGPKAGGSWATSRHGYIYDLDGKRVIVEDLEQPHSLAFSAGQLHYCNSVLGTVETSAGAVAHLSGYSRGLAFAPDGGCYAATSLGRRRGVDPGDDRQFLNLNDQGMTHGRCALIQFPAVPGARLEVGLGFAGAEIYDIAVLGVGE